MTDKPEGTSQRTSRGRIAAALCTAGVVAIAFGGNLLGPAAQDPAVPGEPGSRGPDAGRPRPSARPATERARATAATRAGATAATAATTTQRDDARPAGRPGEPHPQPASAGRRGSAGPAEQPRPAGAPVRSGARRIARAAAARLTRLARRRRRAGQAAGDPGRPRAAGPPRLFEPVLRSAPGRCPSDTSPAPPTPTRARAPPRRPTRARSWTVRRPSPPPRPGRPANAGCVRSGAPPSRRKPRAALEGLGKGGGAVGRPSPDEVCDEVIADALATLAPERASRRDRPAKTRLRNAEGVPTVANPTMSLALPGPVPVGVPNFFIDKFRIPPFLLPIYQAAGIEYGVRWEVLAAINEIETDYGRNLNISSAGALGWMQFMPATWKQYGTDANRDGRKDPFNPVDAIFAAARYLRAAGADDDLRRAIFAYNHADWYVESVLMRARLIGGLPSDLVGSLNGLTQGHFPVVRQGPLRRRPRRAARPPGARGRATQRRAAGRRRRDAPRDRHLRRRRSARDRRSGRHDHGDRTLAAPGRLRPAARRVRQHVHVRAPQAGRPAGAGAQAADPERHLDRPRARAARARPEADAARVRRARDAAQRPRGRAPPPPPPEPDGVERRGDGAAGEGAPVRQPRPPQRPPPRRRCSRSARPSPSSRRGRRCARTSPASTASTPRTSCSSG